MYLDLAAVLGAAAVVVAAALAGRRLLDQGVDIFLWWPPLLARWLPHVGPGTPAAILVALVVIIAGPAVASRSRWPVALAAAWVMASAWTLSLAWVDGFEGGIAGRLSTDVEYLRDVPRVADIGTMLAEFDAHILNDSVRPWSMHVGAHPPGALLSFTWLDRIGLGGGAATGLVCVLIGSSAGVAVAITAKALGAADAARAILPFAVLFPGAVWIGVSADGLFAGVLAWGVALLALGAPAAGVRADLLALAGGLLLGFALFLSYGLVVGGVVALAVLGLARRWRPVLAGAAGVVIVVGAFALAGFWWLDGFELVKVVYAESVAKTRPYSYFVWANLAALLFAIGPAVVAGLRRLLAGPRQAPRAVLWLSAAALLAVLAADLSGMSKAEVERIWLPFSIWLILPCALLPRTQHRYWLIAQALLALLVNHLLWTVW
ncbi:hypothetical protein JYK18_26770 [Amycolatopsis sp. 195334CR]|nr:hypothetical protein [Amycolatopsis sp. 195334CR]